MKPARHPIALIARALLLFVFLPKSGLQAQQAEEKTPPPSATSAPAPVQPPASKTTISAPKIVLPAAPPPSTPLSLTPENQQLMLLPQFSKPDNEEKPLADLPEFDLTTRKPDEPKPDGPNRTEEAALQLARRIRFREVKAQALITPEVRASLEASRRASSDRELRSSLRKYYELLFSQMLSLDPSLEPLLEEQKKRALAPLKQSIGPESRPAEAFANP